jgi:ubiquinone/menaquinone biosynthesis C-methylase UbiE
MAPAAPKDYIGNAFMRDKTGRMMKDFWDAKARENAMYYISSYRPYDEQDPGEFWKWGGILAQQILDESGISFTGEETMLEIGCGIGRMSVWFAERFKHVHGIDVSEEMIGQARDNLAHISNVTVRVGNGLVRVLTH